MKTLLTSLFCLFCPVLVHAQLYGIWESADTVGFTPRFALSSAVLNNQIYVMGGNEDGGKNGSTYSSNAFDVFDPSFNTWNTPITSGTFTPRQKLASCAILSKIYVIGGTGGACGCDLNTVEIYDPFYKSWTPGAAMPTPRSGLTVCILNNLVYAIGGNNGPNFLSTLEVYDPISNKWSTPETGGWFHPMANMTSSVVDNKIYIIGGYDGLSELDSVFIFDPSSNSWSSAATTGNFAARQEHTAGVIGGKIYVLGGFASDFGVPTIMNDVNVFDPVAGTWDTVLTRGSMTARHKLTSSVVNDKMYALGGTDDVSPFNLNEVFYPSTNSVTSETRLENLSLSPNPTTGIVNVRSSSENFLHISVINILGETMLDFPSIQTSDFRFDLSKFPSGIYYAKIISPNSAKVKIIVRQ